MLNFQKHKKKLRSVKCDQFGTPASLLFERTPGQIILDNYIHFIQVARKSFYAFCTFYTDISFGFWNIFFVFQDLLIGFKN